MAKIFLSVPIMHRPELRMIQSMYQAALSCKEHQVQAYYNLNDSLISRVRNVHTSVFYNEYLDYDYFMSIDSDLEIVNKYPNENIFTKLVMAADKFEFSCGLYAIKSPGKLKCSSVMVDDQSFPEFNSGYREVRWPSSGCFCMKRSVIEKMVKAYPEEHYDGDDNAAGKKIYGLYRPFIYEMTPKEFPGLERSYKKYLSEDWAFAQRWHWLGGKVFADTSIVLNHIGSTDYKLYNVEVVSRNANQSESLPSAGFDLSKGN